MIENIDISKDASNNFYLTEPNANENHIAQIAEEFFPQNNQTNSSEFHIGPEIDGYLYNIYEEDNYLFLFLKIFIDDKFQTICVQIEEPRHYLYFSPINKDVKNELVEEVREIAKKCGGYLIESKKIDMFQTKFYAFYKQNVPRESEWLCASFSRLSDLSLIPPTGQFYQFVFGITNTLSDCFRMNNLIKGPRWVHIRKLTFVEENSYTNVPLYKIKNPKNVTVIEDSSIKVPYFNIASFSLRYIHDSKAGDDQVLMISLKIREQCDVEKYKSTKKELTFVHTSEALSVDNVIICESEEQVLDLFFSEINRLGIDILCSYNFYDDYNFIKQRMNNLNKTEKCQIGRMLFVGPTAEFPNGRNPHGGRLLCSLRQMCNEFIQSSSSSFNHVVSQEFNDIYRQPLENVDIVKEISGNSSKLISLIKYNIRDTQFVDALIKKMNLIPLTLQISQLSGCSWHRILGGRKGGPSSRCESLFVHTFSELGFIIPEKYDYSSAEQPKVSSDGKEGENGENTTNQKRVPQYQGGLVLEPQTGFYDNCVLVLDFNSLYPSIIREFNLCFTTMGDEKFDDDQKRVEFAINQTKTKPPGILPSIMANLLEARLKVKKELAEVQKHVSHVTAAPNNPDKHLWLLKEKKLKIQQAAIKILSNAMYGYLGFKYSRFPAIHIAEMVTCLGRHILSSTVEKITSIGHTVIYGDTDSVMIRTATKNWRKALKIAESIGETITSNYQYLKLGVESIFMKFLLLNKKKYAALVFESPSMNEVAPNESINEDDNEIDLAELKKYTWLKIKGLEIIRREWCPLSKYLCNFVLQSFMHSDDQSKASRCILKEIFRITSMLLNDGQPNTPFQIAKSEYSFENIKTEITVNDLVITKGITKPLDQYKPTDKTYNVTVGRWMEKNGHHVRENDVIPYVVTDDKSKEAEKRAKHPDIVYNVCEADIEWYITHQLLPPLLRLCEPFKSPTPESIEDAFGLYVKNPNSMKKTYYLKKLPLNNSNLNHKIITRLYFTCPLCNTQCLVADLVKKAKENKEIICPSCHAKIGWKCASNLIINFVKKQLASWQKMITKCNCGYISEVGRLPLSQWHRSGRGKLCNKRIKTDIDGTDILRTLSAFYRMFTEVIPEGNEDLALLCDSMSSFLSGVLNMHGLNRIQFKSLISVEPFYSCSSE